MDNKELIKAYRVIQETPAFRTRCPRCGGNTMAADMDENCLSRLEDIYICNQCGREEAAFDFAGEVKPLDEWYAIRLMKGEIKPYTVTQSGSGKKVYHVTASTEAKINDETIDDIMATALEGGITYWANKAEPVGGLLGEYGSDQISRGGTLRIYDAEEDASYELTLDKFLTGLSLYLAHSYDEVVYDGWVDAGNIDAIGADNIVQYALFGEVIYG